MQQKRPRIGLVMGDAAGVGPEIVLRTLSDAGVYKCCDPLVLGSAEVLSLARQVIGSQQEIAPVAAEELPLTSV